MDQSHKRMNDTKMDIISDHQLTKSDNKARFAAESELVKLPQQTNGIKPRNILEPLPASTAVRQGRLPPISGLQDSSLPIRLKPMKTDSYKMERQTSSTPLVNGGGLDSSLTGADLSNGLSDKKPIQTINLVRKNSQVQPIVDKEQEANGVTCESPVKDDQSERTSCCSSAVKIITSLLVGIYFGWFLQKSSVYKPRVIRNQFLFEEFIMLKTFLGALFSSQFCLVILSWIPQTKVYVEAARMAYTNTLSHRGVISSLIGAFTLGAGMAVGGGCPGMVLAQNGSLVPNSAYTTLGGFLGVTIYGFLHKYIIKITTPSQPYSTYYVYEKLKAPFMALAIPCIIFCIAAVTLMEIFIPETNNEKMVVNATAIVESSLATCGDNSMWFTQEMWSPAVSGTMIGLVQIPLILVLTDTMGSSSGYLTIASQWVVTKNLQEKFPYFANARTGLQNYWMVIYIIGAAGGGALAALSSCSFLKAQGVVWWQALLGGFLMLFGSRLASGCTSGHGITGAALMIGLSWLAVPAMFGGGICVAFIMEYSGTNYYVDTWEP